MSEIKYYDHAITEPMRKYYVLLWKELDEYSDKFRDAIYDYLKNGKLLKGFSAQDFVLIAWQMAFRKPTQNVLLRNGIIIKRKNERHCCRKIIELENFMKLGLNIPLPKRPPEVDEFIKNFGSFFDENKHDSVKTILH